MSGKAFLAFLIICSFLISCADDKKFRKCDKRMGKACDGKSAGIFCTFGFKWGEGNGFTPYGNDVPGPELPAEVLTFSFAPEGMPFSTHDQADLAAKSVDILPECYKNAVFESLEKWAEVSSLKFTHVLDGRSTDLTFIVGDIPTTGVAFPPFTSSDCSGLNGNIVITSEAISCEGYRLVLLHEIGHALGLGHIRNNVVMDPHYSGAAELQAGDIAGIRSIYGE